MSCVRYYRNHGVCTRREHCAFHHYAYDSIFCFDFRTNVCRNVDTGLLCRNSRHRYAGRNRAAEYQRWMRRRKRIYTMAAFDTRDVTTSRPNSFTSHNASCCPMFVSTLDANSPVPFPVRFVPNVDQLRPASKYELIKPYRNLAFWRGAPAFWDIYDFDVPVHPRISVCMLSLSLPHLVDARITQPDYELASTRVKSLVLENNISNTRVPFAEFFTYSMVFSIDGFGTHGALLALLHGGARVLKVASSMYEWWYDLLVPNVHYIPIHFNLSDAVDTVRRLVNVSYANISANARVLAMCIDASHELLWTQGAAAARTACARGYS